MVPRPRAEEWAVLRELRLEALAAVPDAFGSTLERERRRPEAAWQEWAASGRCFVAEVDGAPSGLASWFVDDEGRAILVSMYVRPGARGHGLGASLVEAVCAAARDGGHTWVGLGVTEGSAARRLYERCGFVATGTRFPLRDGSKLFAEAMTRAL
jgi:GNAT superfamily N-acetyltransferase